MKFSDSARYKLGRASFLKQGLESEVLAFLETTPFAYEKNIDSTGKLLQYCTRILKPIPQSWGLIVGDIVHNLRTSLDHLIFQAVIFNKQEPNDQTAFPFTRHKNDLENQIRSCMNGASENAKKLIRELQPFATGDKNLWRLHRLDIVDKHRLPLTVGAAHESVGIRMQMNVPWQKEPVITPEIHIRPADSQFPISDGSILFQKPVNEVNIPEPSFIFKIAFGEGELIKGESVPVILNEIGKHVEVIIGLFEKQVFV